MFQNFEIQPVVKYCPSGSEQQTCEACLNYAALDVSYQHYLEERQVA